MAQYETVGQQQTESAQSDKKSVESTRARATQQQIESAQIGSHGTAGSTRVVQQWVRGARTSTEASQPAGNRPSRHSHEIRANQERALEYRNGQQQTKTAQ